MGNISQAMEWFNILISVVPTDPEVLAKMGDMYVKENDVTQAFQSYSESYRYFPSNLNVIAWLGAYYVDCEIYDQAVQFFERAALIQPSESKWQLMIASCFRRNGNYQKAFENYKKIHEKFPDNVECLRFLVRICTDLGMKDVHDYINKLAKAEKNKELTATENDIQTEVKSGTPGFVKYEVEKIDTNISHPKANLQKKQTEFEEDWNEDINSLLP
ncbi:Intraflagellar transport protein 88 [Clydaea vesicula]|uniref:Intraflagellar transport protein 88 n=1 Tax=Clydaea vesicula TaxID=447962 RepID=A0AAD5U1N9_9FUNG|nr:Intraflagellar transport protein 88 [Clydaea vesicula]